jgi:hypothetical protein
VQTATGAANFLPIGGRDVNHIDTNRWLTAQGRVEGLSAPVFMCYEHRPLGLDACLGGAALAHRLSFVSSGAASSSSLL